MLLSDLQKLQALIKENVYQEWPIKHREWGHFKIIIVKMKGEKSKHHNYTLVKILCKISNFNRIIQMKFPQRVLQKLTDLELVVHTNNLNLLEVENSILEMSQLTVNDHIAILDQDLILVKAGMVIEMAFAMIIKT